MCTREHILLMSALRISLTTERKSFHFNMNCMNIGWGGGGGGVVGPWLKTYPELGKNETINLHLSPSNSLLEQEVIEV